MRKWTVHSLTVIESILSKCAVSNFRVTEMQYGRAVKRHLAYATILAYCM